MFGQVLRCRGFCAFEADGRKDAGRVHALVAQFRGADPGLRIELQSRHVQIGQLEVVHPGSVRPVRSQAGDMDSQPPRVNASGEDVCDHALRSRLATMHLTRDRVPVRHVGRVLNFVIDGETKTAGPGGHLQ